MSVRNSDNFRKMQIIPSNPPKVDTTGWETPEEYLARGGRVTEIPFGTMTQLERGSGKKMKPGEALKKASDTITELRRAARVETNR